ncbi:MAG: hypothetical protein HKN13_05925 [Rhodothermales bacterium]|nr:hypothetical protein [Rhodothermales bacterium]
MRSIRGSFSFKKDARRMHRRGSDIAKLKSVIENNTGPLLMIVRRTLLIVLLAPLCLTWSTYAQEYPTQKVHRADFQPASDEVFEVLSQFYDYDHTYPLMPRIVESWEDDGISSEKVVFTTQNDDRVPGELAIPQNGD